MQKLIIPALILLLAAPATAYSKTITVRPDGTGDYPTIQAAINAAANGDEIVCTDGTYTGLGNHNLAFDGKAITVRSTEPNDPAVVAETVIDCQEGGRGFDFTNNEQPNSVLAGLTIINARVFQHSPWPSSPKGAICCIRSSPTIRNCVIKYYSADPRHYGSPKGAITCDYDSAPTIICCTITECAEAGIYCENSSPTIKDCIISENAGGISCIEASLTIKDCTVSDNGGGISCESSDSTITGCTLTSNYRGIVCAYSNVAIDYCEISDNNAGNYAGGGGIDCHTSTMTIINSTIEDNIAAWGGGISAGGGSTTVIANCVISNNSAEGEYAYGGGIFYYGGGNHTIANCVVSGNVAEGEMATGGGIYCDKSNPIISNCTISRNNVFGQPDWGGYGAGISCSESSPVIRYCSISANQANYFGGGISCDESSPVITGCNISGNEAEGSGGGVYSGEDSSPIITDCNISANIALGRPGWRGYGGGLYCGTGGPQPGATITNCIISGNTATYGGGLSCSRYAGGIISNCVISGNKAMEDGGGIGCGHSRTVIANCTSTGNLAGNKGGGLYCRGGHPTVTNCIMWGDDAPRGDEIALLDCKHIILTQITVSYSNIQGGYAGVYVEEESCREWQVHWGDGNIEGAPCFIDSGYWGDGNGPNIVVEPNDTNAVWVDGDYHLRWNSPCIEAGDPNYLAGPNETDLDGNPRVLDGHEDGLAVVDMGAYEYVPLPPVEAEMKLMPHTLNCGSRGKYVKAHIALPEGFLPEDVDVSTPAVAEPMDVESAYTKVFGNHGDAVRLEIAFDRPTFCEALSDMDTGSLEVTVTGSLTTGQYFEGTDTIRIKPNRRQLTPKLLKNGLNKPHGGKSL